MTLIDQSSRVALPAFLHDIGKLAERVGIEQGGRLDAHKTIYCPFHSDGAGPGYHTHIRILNAKVAYAKGRGLVGDEFERWFRECIKSTTGTRALDHVRLHFVAVLGFLNALRG